MQMQRHLAGEVDPLYLVLLWVLGFLLGAVNSHFLLLLLQEKFTLREVYEDGKIAMFLGPDQITFFNTPFPIF